MTVTTAQDIATLLAQAAGAPDRAEPLYALADLFLAAGDDAECAAVFGRAYRLRPAQRPMLNRDPGLPQALRAEQLRRYAQALIDHGAGYTAVIRALAVAQTLLGERAAVERLYDHERFVTSWLIDPPTPCSDEEFRAALAEACIAKLRYYDSDSKVAFRSGWRNVDLMASQAPAFVAFQAEMRRQVEHYIAALPKMPDHPFIAATPQAFEIDSWAVVSNGASYHQPHIHPRAWLTGVYYVERPEASRAPGADCGWLKLTPPRPLKAAGKDWLTRTIEPEAGHLVLMPGYFFHSTEPVGADQRQICIAFDVRPAEVMYRPHADAY